nr:hypothetical protein [Hungatella effluvii]
MAGMNFQTGSNTQKKPSGQGAHSTLGKYGRWHGRVPARESGCPDSMLFYGNSIMERSNPNETQSEHFQIQKKKLSDSAETK